MKCDNRCLYFPDYTKSTIVKEYIDNYGISHIEREYICGYDDHRITAYTECQYYKKCERVKI